MFSQILDEIDYDKVHVAYTSCQGNRPISKAEVAGKQLSANVVINKRGGELYVSAEFS